MATQGPIFQGPPFGAPEIKPHQTWLERFAAGLAKLSPQVKAALITVCSTFAVATFYSIVQCSHVSRENALLKHDAQNMAGKIREQDSTILKLTTEKASLANQAAVAASIPLHVPSIISNLDNILATEPTNRQQLLSLLYSVEALTNSLAESTLRPTFDLLINGTKITNGVVLDLKQSRTMDIRVRNTSSISIEQLEIDLGIPLQLDPTNLDAQGWQLYPSITKSINGKEIKSGNQWGWHADRVISGSGGTSDNWVDIVQAVNSIHISTNYQYPDLRVVFVVYAARSKPLIQQVMLKF
jgi:hypothetical protein